MIKLIFTIVMEHIKISILKTTQKTNFDSVTQILDLLESICNFLDYKNIIHTMRLLNKRINNDINTHKKINKNILNDVDIFYRNIRFLLENPRKDIMNEDNCLFHQYSQRYKCFVNNVEQYSNFAKINILFGNFLEKIVFIKNVLKLEHDRIIEINQYISDHKTVKDSFKALIYLNKIMNTENLDMVFYFLKLVKCFLYQKINILKS